MNNKLTNLTGVIIHLVFVFFAFMGLIGLSLIFQDKTYYHITNYIDEPYCESYTFNDEKEIKRCWKAVEVFGESNE